VGGGPKVVFCRGEPKPYRRGRQDGLRKVGGPDKKRKKERISIYFRKAKEVTD